MLVGLQNLGIAQLSVWHGRLQPGGRSDLHIHPESVQVYVGLSGEMVVGDSEREEILDKLGSVVFDAGTSHFIENRSDQEAEVLVISSPGLR